MSKLFKSKTFKVGGLVIALAMAVFVGGANSAAAQTTTVVAPAFTYSGTMRVGMSGPGISTLQAALNSVNGSNTIVVDGKFGPATLAAVKMFQMNHSLVPDGVVGPKTGAALATATVAVITVPTPTGPLCPNGNTLASNCMTAPAGTPTGPLCPNGMTLASNCMTAPGGSTSLSGGETSITGISVDDADDDSINEGANKAPVADIQFDVDDADAQLVRADVVFQAADGNVSGGEVKPWRVFDKAYLMDGSTVLSTMDASDQDNWDDADDVITGSPVNQAYRIRFNNVNKIYKEGSNNNDLWVAVDVASSVDNAGGSDEDWTVGVDSDGLRFTDGAGVDTFEDTSDTASFSIDEAGAQSDLNITEDSSTPDAGTLEVKESSSTTDTVAVFKVKADEDGGDIKIDDFPIQLVTSHSTGNKLSDVVDDVLITVDGNTYSTDTTPSTSLATQTFHFSDIEDDDVTIDSGDSMLVTVKVKFKSQGSGPTYANGTTIVASVNAAASDFEDADSGDDIGTVSGGTASGETMTLAGNGISVDIQSAKTTVTANDGATNDNVEFKWTIDVTAFGDNDVYINKDNADIVQTEDVNDVDTVYTVQQSGGTALTGLTGTITTSSSADTVTGVGGAVNAETFYKISSGDHETFTITVSTTNTADSKQVQAILSDLEFLIVSPTTGPAAGAIQHYTANLAEDSQTGYSLVN